MPLFRRPSCVRRCASYSQTVNSTGDAPVCGAYVRLKLGTGDQFRPSRENSRTKLQDVVTDSRDDNFAGEIMDFLRVLLDELAARFDFVAHERPKQSNRPSTFQPSCLINHRHQ